MTHERHSPGSKAFSVFFQVPAEGNAGPMLLEVPQRVQEVALWPAQTRAGIYQHSHNS